MLQVVITIIIMIILAMVAILYGNGIPREANIAAVYSEMRSVESALKEALLLNKLKVSGDTLVIWDEIAVPEINPSDYTIVLGGETSATYYYLNFSSSRKLGNILDIENIESDYILDYANLNVYYVDGVDVLGSGDLTILYNSDDIEQYYSNTF